MAPVTEHAAQDFPTAALPLLHNAQLRSNVRHATDVIQGKRFRVVHEMPDWQLLRDAGQRIRQHALEYLDGYLEQFEHHCIAAGGHVHWARDAAEANRIVLQLARNETGRVIKIKSMTTEEIGLNRALEAAGMQPIETDLAELIVQLGHDKPSHIVVPALHKNRHEIRELFARTMNLPELGDRPEDLTEAARVYLRQQFLTTPIAVSGANFLIAETGGVCIVESEGNGRMCLTLPQKLITIAGIDKILPRFRDLEVFLQLLPRSATGERMNPYNSLWTGVRPGDGPQEFHVVLLDNRRTEVLRDPESRETLHCIRCGACQNACPVYRQTGGHAYNSVYAGPIGAILSPQLALMKSSQSLPYASSLCGACYEVCPVKINIPEILIHLRGRVVEGQPKLIRALHPEAVAMRAMQWIFLSQTRLKLAQWLGRIAQRPFIRRSGWIEKLPGILGGWTRTRDLRPLPEQSFRAWFQKHNPSSAEAPHD
ncbi:MAG TPA: LutB/LldF family L-lactate oxidation iron-sulfur protein [Acidobacteriaceae bacterium]|jgi:L-lactate dehydrogenase complex protein LldF|nr:LutB/LldF family L-lactate oxidation iron-sulfur protein [Acidobacteriaceae bacterium]